ncbi:MAG: hypothetical protein HYW79_01955 [Parcubacteria group bacterium]|nr:hypothetical protein [Parcubacteria group bacterium]
MTNIKKQKNNDYFLMLSAVLLLTVVGFVVGFSLKKELIVPVADQLKMEIIGSVVLTIDFGNGKIRSFEGDIVKNETPIDTLIQASKAGDFSYRLDEKSNLSAIESFVKNSEKSWYWYLNGKKMLKPYEIFLQDGDKISIIYESR